MEPPGVTPTITMPASALTGSTKAGITTQTFTAGNYAKTAERGQVLCIVLLAYPWQNPAYNALQDLAATPLYASLSARTVLVRYSVLMSVSPKTLIRRNFGKTSPVRLLQHIEYRFDLMYWGSY